MEEIRCGSCRRLLARGTAEMLEIKCPRCGTMNHVRVMNPLPERPRAPDSIERVRGHCD
ncbi:zinc finger domain-containing protein [Azospirillum agricola]|uniref:zinc finger domain-containing protein n=1 Tax=Azospirillum agricola TaxID=1720247 RepID=UPI000A0F042E|nr:zinc finger domain-containing protein, LSD1 subclass [Azospirillum lipoferum]